MKRNYFNIENRKDFADRLEKLRARKERIQKNKEAKLQKIAQRKAGIKEISPPVDVHDSDLKEVMGIDVKKFIRLIKKRSGGNDLHMMVDMVQAQSALSTLAIVESIQNNINRKGIDNISTDDRVKMLNSIKGAISSSNETLKALGISKISRESDAPDDNALKILLDEDLKYNIPPSLKQEFLSFSGDIERASVPTISDISSSEKSAAPDSTADALSLIKKPIESYEEENKEGRSAGIINADKVTVRELG